MVNVKFLTGSKEGIDAKIEAGEINGGDIIFTSDTDEIVFMNPQQTPEKRVIKSKSQKDYTLKGVQLGDLSDGDVISSGIDIDDLLAIITKKTIAPEYKAPEIKLNDSLEVREFEVGDTVSFTLRSRFVKNDAGDIVSHKIYKNNSEIYSKEGPLVSLEIGSLTIAKGENVFISKAIYNEGEIKNNNFNEPSPEGRIEAGEIESNPLVYNGYRKMFFESGAEELSLSAIRDFKNSILNPQKSQEIEMEMNIGEQYISFAYPASLGDIQKISYVQLNDDMTSNFEQTSAFVEGANGYEAVEYKVYSYKTAMPIAAKMTFKVII